MGEDSGAEKLLVRTARVSEAKQSLEEQRKTLLSMESAEKEVLSQLEQLRLGMREQKEEIRQAGIWLAQVERELFEEQMGQGVGGPVLGPLMECCRGLLGKCYGRDVPPEVCDDLNRIHFLVNPAAGAPVPQPVGVQGGPEDPGATPVPEPPGGVDGSPITPANGEFGPDEVMEQYPPYDPYREGMEADGGDSEYVPTESADGDGPRGPGTPLPGGQGLVTPDRVRRAQGGKTVGSAPVSGARPFGQVEREEHRDRSRDRSRDRGRGQFSSRPAQVPGSPAVQAQAAEPPAPPFVPGGVSRGRSRGRGGRGGSRGRGGRGGKVIQAGRNHLYKSFWRGAKRKPASAAASSPGDRQPVAASPVQEEALAAVAASPVPGEGGDVVVDSPRGQGDPRRSEGEGEEPPPSPEQEEPPSPFEGGL